MYRIYADDTLLYDPSLFHEGYGVVSPKMTIEMNKAGSLNFTLPPNNHMYNELFKMNTIITVYDDGDEVFRGRILDDEKDFYKQKKVYCEGELAFLLDSIQRPYTFTEKTPYRLMEYLINNHNSSVEAKKQFIVGGVQFTDILTCGNKNYPTTLDEILDTAVELTGGYLRTRGDGNKRVIDLLDGTYNANNLHTQVIEFGTNLIDITEHISAENVFTVIIPLGATLEDSEGNSTDEKLTIADKNNGSDRLVSTKTINGVKVTDLFGYIERKVEWSEVEDVNELMELAQETLDENIEMAVELTLTAVDLHLLNVDVERIHVGDWVRVQSLPHDIDRPFQCRKITYDLHSPENNEYSFGVDFTTLTDQQVTDKKKMNNSVSQVLSTAGAVNASVNKVNKATEDVNNIISTLPTDYVNEATFNAYKEDVNSEFAIVNDQYADLLARVVKLEGGGA